MNFLQISSVIHYQATQEDEGLRLDQTLSRLAEIPSNFSHSLELATVTIFSGFCLKYALFLAKNGPFLAKNDWFRAKNDQFPVKNPSFRPKIQVFGQKFQDTHIFIFFQNKNDFVKI